jgi:hypothetical protein
MVMPVVAVVAAVSLSCTVAILALQLLSKVDRVTASVGGRDDQQMVKSYLYPLSMHREQN